MGPANQQLGPAIEMCRPAILASPNARIEITEIAPYSGPNSNCSLNYGSQLLIPQLLIGPENCDGFFLFLFSQLGPVLPPTPRRVGGGGWELTTAVELTDWQLGSSTNASINGHAPR
jgi:hypothetical protein